MSSTTWLAFSYFAQKTFVKNVYQFAWGFGIEKWWGLLVNLQWFPFLKETKHEKLGEHLEQNSGQNSGRNITKFGELSFCNFSDLTFLDEDGSSGNGHPAGRCRKSDSPAPLLWVFKSLALRHQFHNGLPNANSRCFSAHQQNPTPQISY